MLPPAYVLGFTLATFWGVACHFILGGGLRQLLRYLLVGWFGFALGQGIGQALGNEIWVIGSVQVFPASLGAVILLAHSALRSGRMRSRVR